MTNPEQLTLEKRLFQFLGKMSYIEDLDKSYDIDGEKADYLYAYKSCILEVKNIKSDPSIKVNNFIDKLSTRDDYPLFFGTRNINQVFEHLDDKEELRKELFNKITHQLEKALKKANRQIKNTKKQLNLHRANGVVFLLNDQILTLGPEELATRAYQVLIKKLDGLYRYNEIELVVIMSETHSMKRISHFKEALPILCVEGPKCSEGLTDRFDPLFHDWSKFNGHNFCKAENSMHITQDLFKERGLSDENILSEKITRQGLWENQYRQNRYAKYMSKDKFLTSFARVMTKFNMHILKEYPNLPQEEVNILSEELVHCFEEAKIRNLDMRELEKYLKKL